MKATIEMDIQYLKASLYFIYHGGIQRSAAQSENDLGYFWSESSRLLNALGIRHYDCAQHSQKLANLGIKDTEQQILPTNFFE